jgi:hypothetical protein
MIGLSLLLKLLQRQLFVALFQIFTYLRDLSGVKQFGIVCKEVLFAKETIHIPEVKTLRTHLLVVQHCLSHIWALETIQSIIAFNYVV